MDRVQRFVCKNGVVDFIFVLTAEWRLLEKHLVDEDAERPPIHCPAVLLIQKNLGKVSPVHTTRRQASYLRCHEFRGTTECARRRAVPHIFFAKTVIRNLDMAVKGEKDVVELQVTVDDTVLVEILERETDLGSVEPGQVSGDTEDLKNPNILCSLGTELATLNVKHQVTTTDILHDEVNTGFRLETCVQVQQEGVSLLVCDQKHTLF